MTMRTTIETIGPKKAAKLLENNKLNRPLTQRLVDKYADDMKNGRWYLTHQGIGIDTDGNVVDGQHRLWAILQANIEIQTKVTYGVDPKARVAIDTGKARSFADIMKLEGVITKQVPMASSVCRRMFSGGLHSPGRTPSISVLKLFYLIHQEPIHFIVEQFPKHISHITNASVLAAIACAWYYVDDKLLLERFCAVMTDGVSEGRKEQAAIALRNWLLAKDHMGRSAKGSKETFYKTGAAIRAFIRKKPLVKLPFPKNPPFPLPEVDPSAGIKSGLTKHNAVYFRRKFKRLEKQKEEEVQKGDAT